MKASSPAPVNAPYTLLQKAAAWGVHLFTASGMVAGFFAIVAISERHFALAFGWLFLTLFIDGVDGTLARRFHVTEVLPWMSGKTMDYVIDFATYAIIPAYLIYAAPLGVAAEPTQYLVPESLRAVSAALILLVSALYYGKTGMVSEDYYFVGFPVMWNLVAFYLYYVFGLPAMGNFALIVLFAILHFVPIKYLYPSQTREFKAWNILMSILLVASNLALMGLLEWGSTQYSWIAVMKLLSLGSLGYFTWISVYQTLK